MNLAEAVEIEPGLKQLITIAEFAGSDAPDGDFCANEIWYRDIKPIFVQLVGWDAPHKELRSSEVYDQLLHELYNMLPNCQGNCSCM